jgi:hypothetical protein
MESLEPTKTTIDRSEGTHQTTIETEVTVGDSPAEHRLELEHLTLQKLRDSGMTYLSVGHRESLSDYHQSILDFAADGDRTRALKTSEAKPILPPNNLAEEDVKVS